MLTLAELAVMPPSGFGFAESEELENSVQFLFAPQEMTPISEDDRYPAQSWVAPMGSSPPELNRDEERRIRRMISNRESARRSRMRKQHHLEELRSRVDRLRLENRELEKRLGAVTRQCLLFCRDNDRLRSEASVLRHKLFHNRQVLLVRQLQRLVSPPACGGVGGPSTHVSMTQAANGQVYDGGYAPAIAGQTLLT